MSLFYRFLIHCSSTKQDVSHSLAWQGCNLWLDKGQTIPPLPCELCGMFCQHGKSKMTKGHGISTSCITPAIIWPVSQFGDRAERFDYFVIQIKYGLPYCVTCPSMSTDPGSLNPGTRRSRVPGWWDPWIRTNTTSEVRENCCILLTGILCHREAVWVAAESGDLWSWALFTTHYYYNYQYFCIQWH